MPKIRHLLNVYRCKSSPTCGQTGEVASAASHAATIVAKSPWDASRLHRHHRLLYHESWLWRSHIHQWPLKLILNTTSSGSSLRPAHGSEAPDRRPITVTTFLDQMKRKHLVTAARTDYAYSFSSHATQVKTRIFSGLDRTGHCTNKEKKPEPD